MQLVIGDKTFSSWSLRPWLVLKRCGAEFEEAVVRLNQPETAAELARLTPAGQVPVLKVEGVDVWDSMAISVWCAERYPEAGLWPTDAHARWLARSAACEMHSGFAALRTQCPMNLSLREVAQPSEGTARDLRRLTALWREMRARFGAGGDFLFGRWSVPDAFFTPVATRVRSYGLDLAAHGDDGAAQAYVEALLAQPHFLQWEREAAEVR